MSRIALMRVHSLSMLPWAVRTRLFQTYTCATFSAMFSERSCDVRMAHAIHDLWKSIPVHVMHRSPEWMRCACERWAVKAVERNLTTCAVISRILAAKMVSRVLCKEEMHYIEFSFSRSGAQRRLTREVVDNFAREPYCRGDSAETMNIVKRLKMISLIPQVFRFNYWHFRRHADHMTHFRRPANEKKIDVNRQKFFWYSFDLLFPTLRPTKWTISCNSWPCCHSHRFCPETWHSDMEYSCNFVLLPIWWDWLDELLHVGIYPSGQMEKKIERIIGQIVLVSTDCGVRMVVKGKDWDRFTEKRHSDLFETCQEEVGTMRLPNIETGPFQTNRFNSRRWPVFCMPRRKITVEFVGIRLPKTRTPSL
jgi:hypothetical protein